MLDTYPAIPGSKERTAKIGFAGLVDAANTASERASQSAQVSACRLDGAAADIVTEVVLRRDRGSEFVGLRFGRIVEGASTDVEVGWYWTLRERAIRSVRPACPRRP